MDSKRLSRKLTAILYADIAGYSRLTRQDEVGTHHQVMEILDYASDAIEKRGGGVLRYAGDAILAEFQSVVAAAEAAFGIQSELSVRNSDKPEDEKIQLRIGLNLGEVMQDRGEIFGDGVNLAARLEAAATPGGVCISSTVYEQIAGKVGVDFEDGGEEIFKNIDKPIHIYRWHPGLSVQYKSAEALALPDIPSIAVLPFENMSSDPEQEYFADGMTEDIITALSHITALTVIARNSTFAYKGKSVKVQDIARDLNVRYVLEGSVRKSGQRVRITAQLIEAFSGHHLWAERYDRDLNDVFEIQDEITRNITVALQVQLSFGEHARIWQGGTRNFEAWQCQIRGVQAFYKSTREGRSEAAEHFEKAIVIDPDYVPALTALGYTYCNFARYRDASDPTKSLQEAEDIAEKLLEDSESEAHGYALLSQIRLTQCRHEEAIAACTKAVELAPNNPNHHGMLASILAYSQPKQALQHVNLAIKLSPHYPNWFTSTIFLSHYLQGDFDKARQVAEAAIARFPDFPFAYINLAGIYSALGLDHQAHETTEMFLRMQPDFSLSEYESSQVFQDSKDTETWVGHLRKAGLPD